MTLSTTFHQQPLMTEKTFNRRLLQLKEEIMQHPYKDELLHLAQEQLIDDTFVLVTPEV